MILNRDKLQSLEMGRVRSPLRAVSFTVAPTISIVRSSADASEEPKGVQTIEQVGGNGGIQVPAKMSRRGLFVRLAAASGLFFGAASADPNCGVWLSASGCPASGEGDVTYCYDDLGRIVSGTRHGDHPLY